MEKAKVGAFQEDAMKLPRRTFLHLAAGAARLRSNAVELRGMAPMSSLPVPHPPCFGNPTLMERSHQGRDAPLHETPSPKHERPSSRRLK